MDEITILIIEDDEDIRESVKILLENEGFHVIEADNGMDGLHQIFRGYGSCYFGHYDAWDFWHQNL